MIRLLPEKFEKAADGMKIQSFTQLRREGNVLLYERRRRDGTLFGYEVFRAKVKPSDGLKPPLELYPKAPSFGKTAFFCKTIERAEIRFSELLARQEAA